MNATQKDRAEQIKWIADALPRVNGWGRKVWIKDLLDGEFTDGEELLDLHRAGYLTLTRYDMQDNQNKTCTELSYMGATFHCLVVE